MKTSRRTFLGCAGAAPFILPGSIWAADVKPSERLNMGIIGTGKMAQGIMNNFRGMDEVQIVAVCDVDSFRRTAAQERLNEYYKSNPKKGTADVKAYRDYRELLADPKIDIVYVGTPDHWHASVTVAALKAGKDVYCEKPLTHNIMEAVAVMTAVKKYNRVLQTGSQQRSSKEFRIAAELVRNGVLGKIKSVNVFFGGAPKPYDMKAEPMEPGLDWDFWCGPGPVVDYNSKLSAHGIPDFWPNWRGFREFGTGGVGDWGAHMLDIAHWGLDMDNSGPVEITPPADGKNHGTVLKYPTGVEVIHTSGQGGVTFNGENGMVRVHRGQFELVMNGQPFSRFWDKKVDTGTSCEAAYTKAEKTFLKDAKVHLYTAPRGGHTRNFVDCVKSREKPGANELIGAHTVIGCHLILQSYYHREKMNWDPVNFRFTNGTGNPAWLTREYRQGYGFPAV